MHQGCVLGSKHPRVCSRCLASSIQVVQHTLFVFESCTIGRKQKYIQRQNEVPSMRHRERHLAKEMCLPNVMAAVQSWYPCHTWSAVWVTACWYWCLVSRRLTMAECFLPQITSVNGLWFDQVPKINLFVSLKPSYLIRLLPSHTCLWTVSTIAVLRIVGEHTQLTVCSSRN